MKSILVVDDEVDLLFVLKEILQAYGYQVATAENGEQAFTYLLSHNEPSLIFLDLTMPVMNGVKFLELLQSGAHPTLAHIPVVIVSAVGEFVPLERFKCAGILKKPTDLQKILGMAERFAR